MSQRSPGGFACSYGVTTSRVRIRVLINVVVFVVVKKQVAARRWNPCLTETACACYTWVARWVVAYIASPVFWRWRLALGWRLSRPGEQTA